MTPQTKKVLLGLGAFMAFSFVCCIIFGIVGAAWIRTWFDGALEQGQASVAEAETFAAGHDQNACVQEGLRRVDACGETEVMCQVGAGLFLQPCLERATPVAGFCDGVPRSGEIMASAQWAVSECTRLNHAQSQPCRQLVQAIQRQCDAP